MQRVNGKYNASWTSSRKFQAHFDMRDSCIVKFLTVAHKAEASVKSFGLRLRVEHHTPVSALLRRLDQGL